LWVRLEAYHWSGVPEMAGTALLKKYLTRLERRTLFFKEKGGSKDKTQKQGK
jgi:hypothetical protein